MIMDMSMHLTNAFIPEKKPLDESMNKANKSNDIKDIIEDFLCGDLVPKVKKNKRLLGYFCQDSKHCMILFTFILDPDNYEVSPKVKITSLTR